MISVFKSVSWSKKEIVPLILLISVLVLTTQCQDLGRFLPSLSESVSQATFSTGAHASKRDCHVLYLPLLQRSADAFAARSRHTSSALLPNCPPTPTMPDGLPSWGAPIAISPFDERVWVVNPDAGSVTMIDRAVSDSKRITKEVLVGQAPWSLAISPDGGTVYVVDRANGALVVVDAHSHVVRATLSVGPEPGQVALSPTGSLAYVTITSADEVAVVDTSRLEVVARIPVEPMPYAIAVTDDGDAFDEDEQVVVTHFFAFLRDGGQEATDDGREGRVTMLDAGTNGLIEQIALSPDEHGFPNLLASVAIAGNRAWVPQVRAAPDVPTGLTTTVFAAVSSLDLDHSAKEAEDTKAHLPLNDQHIFGSPVNNPVAAIPSPDGQRLYVVLAGSDLLEVVDLSDAHQPRLLRFLSVGKNPRGIAISRDGRRGYVGAIPKKNKLKYLPALD